MRRSVLAVSAAVLLAAPAAAKADEGDIIVQRAPGLDAHERTELRVDAGVNLVEALPIERTELVAPKDGDVAEALRELRTSGEVVSAEPDQRVAATSQVPNDFFWSSLWALHNSLGPDIDALDAWDVSRGASVTVGVVDSGVNAAHVDLAGQVLPNGWDYVDRDNDPDDENGHGSHVAGIIAAIGSNNSGVIGVAPESKLLPVRALDKEGDGWMSDIASSFAYAADAGVPIVNASLDGGYASVLENVIQRHPNTLFVVAAGNNGDDNDVAATADFPCAMPEDNIVCVGASDQRDERASFSNYGARSVDLFAPGTGILSTWKAPGNAYWVLKGTSMAAPHVAGALALMKAANPSATPAQLKWALLQSVDPSEKLSGLAVSGGRLNAFAAVEAVKGALPPTPTPTPTPEPPVPTPTATPVAPVATPEPDEPPATTPPAVTPPSPAAPAPIAAPAPRLLNLRLTGSLKTAKSKLRVRFSLSLPATVRFTVTRKGKRVASWTRSARGGATAVTLTRKLPTGVTHKPGAYTLAVGLSASATTSRSIRVR
jgi:thermitase